MHPLSDQHRLPLAQHYQQQSYEPEDEAVRHERALFVHRAGPVPAQQSHPVQRERQTHGQQQFIMPELTSRQERRTGVTMRELEKRWV